MPTVIRQTGLAGILLSRGLLTAEQLDAYEADAQGSERQLRAALVRDQVLSETAWAEALAEQYGLPFEALDGYRVDFERFSTIPVEAMRQFGFVPVDEREGVLIVAVADPHDLRLLDHVDRILGRDFHVVVAPKSGIVDALQESERNAQMVARVRDEFRPLLIRENEQGEEVLSADKIHKDLRDRKSVV